MVSFRFEFDAFSAIILFATALGGGEGWIPVRPMPSIAREVAAARPASRAKGLPSLLPLTIARPSSLHGRGGCERTLTCTC